MRNVVRISGGSNFQFAFAPPGALRSCVKLGFAPFHWTPGGAANGAGPPLWHLTLPHGRPYGFGPPAPPCGCRGSRARFVLDLMRWPHRIVTQRQPPASTIWSATSMLPPWHAMSSGVSPSCVVELASAPAAFHPLAFALVKKSGIVGVVAIAWGNSGFCRLHSRFLLHDGTAPVSDGLLARIVHVLPSESVRTVNRVFTLRIHT